MAAALKALRVGQSVSTGQLHKQLFPHEQMGRNEFESLLGVLAGAGLVSMEDAAFEKEGRSINYRKVSLTADAEDLEEGLLARLMVKDGFAVPLMKAGLKKRVSGSAPPEASSDPVAEEAALTGRAGELWAALRASARRRDARQAGPAIRAGRR